MVRIFKATFCFIALLTILCMSCTSIFYGVNFVPKKTKCDTTSNRLNLRIINSGKVGFSSITLSTDSGDVVISGVKPGDTSCYYPIPPIYENAKYKISTLRLRRFGQADGIAFSNVIANNEGKEKFSSGFCTLIIEISDKRKTKSQPSRVIIQKN